MPFKLSKKFSEAQIKDKIRTHLQSKIQIKKEESKESEQDDALNNQEALRREDIDSYFREKLIELA